MIDEGELHKRVKSAQEWLWAVQNKIKEPHYVDDLDLGLMRALMELHELEKLTSSPCLTARAGPRDT